MSFQAKSVPWTNLTLLDALACQNVPRHVRKIRFAELTAFHTVVCVR